MGNGKEPYGQGETTRLKKLYGIKYGWGLLSLFVVLGGATGQKS